MRIEPVNDNRKQYLELLLLADEQESMIDRYLERGEMFALFDEDLKAVCVVTDEGDGVFELKNIAVCPRAQKQGYGKKLIDFLYEWYRGRGRRMLVGTGDSPATIPFYRRCGFTESHRIRNFFTENYDHPIYECGRQLTDMVYLKRDLYFIETPRLGLRRLCTGDLAALSPILGDPAVMYAWEYGFSDEQIEKWIARNLASYERNGYGYFAAIRRDTGELAGQIGLLAEEIEGRRHVGLGYILGKRHWGKGYAAEGARACMDYAFEALGADRVIAEIRPQNTASRKVAERLGMKLTGEFVKQVDGRAMPHLIYTETRESGQTIR